MNTGLATSSEKTERDDMTTELRRRDEDNGRDDKRDDKDERRDDKHDDKIEKIHARTDLIKYKAARLKWLVLLIAIGLGGYALLSTGSLGFLKNLIGK